MKHHIPDFLDTAEKSGIPGMEMLMLAAFWVSFFERFFGG